MLVVDVKRMRIVGEYGTSAIGRDGCGGRQQGDSLYLNSGTGTPVTNPSQFTVFSVRDRFPSAPAFRPPTSRSRTSSIDDTTPETPNDAPRHGPDQARPLPVGVRPARQQGAGLLHQERSAEAHWARSTS